MGIWNQRRDLYTGFYQSLPKACSDAKTNALTTKGIYVVRSFILSDNLFRQAELRIFPDGKG